MQWHDGADYCEWGSAARRPLVAFDGAHKGEWLDSVIGPDAASGQPTIYHIVRCELCICTHIWPLPDETALKTYYETQFYQVDKVDMVARYERDRDWWEQCVHGPILRHVNALLPSIVHPRILDVGAGVGIALDVAKHEYGFSTWGLEPNKDLCINLQRRGHCVMQGTLDDYVWKQKYHCLYLYETLEHMPWPEETLLRCYDLLEPGGVIVVVVPNDYNPLQLAACKYLDMNPWWLAPPQHLFYFTPKTLQLLVRRCGFTIQSMRGSYPLERELLQGRNYVGNDAIGRQVHEERMGYEMAMLHKGKWSEVEEEYAENLRHREGREIICIAQKGII